MCSSWALILCLHFPCVCFRISRAIKPASIPCVLAPGSQLWERKGSRRGQSSPFHWRINPGNPFLSLELLVTKSFPRLAPVETSIGNHVAVSVQGPNEVCGYRLGELASTILVSTRQEKQQIVFLNRCK